MKKILVAITLLLIATGVAMAQNGVTVKADIPFDFYASDRLMPAGVYFVVPASDSDRVTYLLRPAEPVPGAFVGTYQVSTKQDDRQDARLIFNKYTEDRIFLSRIVPFGSANAREVPKSKKEREMVISTLRAGLAPTKVVILAMAR
jgi:hypothetical protein